MLLTRKLNLSYGQEQALKQVDLSLDSGESVAIVGPSGSGKSSLLYCLSGLERPTSGQVFFEERDMAKMSANERSQLRLRSFGFVFQSSDLVPELTLRDNIALPLELAGQRRRQARNRVNELIEALGLQECADRRTAQVSGGQAQRAAVVITRSTIPAILSSWVTITSNAPRAVRRRIPPQESQRPLVCRDKTRPSRSLSVTANS